MSVKSRCTWYKVHFFSLNMLNKNTLFCLILPICFLMFLLLLSSLVTLLLIKIVLKFEQYFTVVIVFIYNLQKDIDDSAFIVCEKILFCIAQLWLFMSTCVIFLSSLNLHLKLSYRLVRLHIKDRSPFILRKEEFNNYLVKYHQQKSILMHKKTKLKQVQEIVKIMI